MTTALSYLQGNFLFLPDPGVPLSLDLDFKLYALSGRYDAERFSLTTEYVYSTFAGNFNGTNLSSTSDGAYVQGDYRLNPAWTVMARYDASFSDNGDRDGSECRDFVSGMPRDPHGCFAHDFMLGGNWKYGEHWGVWAEGHLIDGNSTVSPGDNAGRTPENHWSLFLLMAAYRF